MIRALVVGAFYLVWTVLGAIVGFPWTFLTGKVDFIYWIGTRGAYAGVRLGGVAVDVFGREHFDPQGTYIFMCNHVSNLDPPIVVPLIPRRTSVLVKKELFRVPLLGRAMLMGSLVPVDRSDRDAAVASIRSAAEVLRKGINMTIFPEGTRSRDGRLLPFKKGPFYLALESGCPIVPMTIVGSRELMPKGSLKLRGGRVQLHFHEPVLPAEYPEREELMEAVRQRIAGALPEKYR